MSQINWVECETDEIDIVRLWWWEGSTHDPAGYYLTVTFKGSRHQMFLDFCSEKPKGKPKK